MWQRNPPLSHRRPWVMWSSSTMRTHRSPTRPLIGASPRRRPRLTAQPRSFTRCAPRQPIQARCKPCQPPNGTSSRPLSKTSTPCWKATHRHSHPERIATRPVKPIGPLRSHAAMRHARCRDSAALWPLQLRDNGLKCGRQMLYRLRARASPRWPNGLAAVVLATARWGFTEEDRPEP